MIMTGKSRRFLISALYTVFTASITVTAGCASDSYAAKGAGEGATTGAVAGAVGGMVTALVFGGNVAEAGARGAVYGSRRAGARLVARPGKCVARTGQRG